MRLALVGQRVQQSVESLLACRVSSFGVAMEHCRSVVAEWQVLF